MRAFLPLTVFLLLPAGGIAQPRRPGPDVRPFRVHALRRAGRADGIRFRRARFHRVRRRSLRRAFTPPHLIRRAARLAPHRRKALREVEHRITPRWMRAQTELRIARMNLARTLRDPDSSPEAIQKALREVRAREQEVRALQDETLLELRKALKGSDFSRLFAPPRQRRR